ncbi:hypothetical protein RRF57_011618 [Xylaria bambusicola]|uniref:Uncharacterized protein n=1 Tax=Xylaria bambusicola TaxID=326684 RepID=A0AAN7UU12_9PEZI
MCIGAAEPERINTGSARLTWRRIWPRRHDSGDLKMCIERLHLRIEMLEMQIRWNESMLDAPDDLENTCKTSSSFCVSNYRLDRSDKHLLFRIG